MYRTTIGELMSNTLKKTINLCIGLISFALLSTLLLFAAEHNFFREPKLSDGFRFENSIPEKKLHFSDHEVDELNSSISRNENVVSRAILTITAAGERHYTNRGAGTPLEFSLKVKGKNGMIFAPGVIKCNRDKLVPRIVKNIEHGAATLAKYVNNPALKNKNITIVDM